MREQKPAEHQQTHDAAHDAHATDHHAATTGHASSVSAGGRAPAVHSESATHARTASASERAHDHKHVPGGTRNVGMTSLNRDHHGHTDAQGRSQASRLGFGGKNPSLAADNTPVYDNNGKIIGHVHKGPIDINTGQITELRLQDAEGHPATDKTLCVLTHGHPPGWIATSAFEEVHRADIEKVQKRLDHHIDGERHAAADRHKDGKARTIVATAAPSNIDKMFTKPFQQANTSNHAHDYYVRSGGHVNLLVNLPTWDKHGSSIDERLGLAADIVAVGTTFHQLSETANIPVYHHNSNTQAGHITFVYGYVENSGGQKRLGWINQALLA